MIKQNSTEEKNNETKTEGRKIMIRGSKNRSGSYNTNNRKSNID